MLINQITKNIFTNKSSIRLVNPIKRSFFSKFKTINLLSINETALFRSRFLATKKNFFSSNKEEKKESKKDEESKSEQESKKDEEVKTEQETKKEENKTEQESDKALNEKYKELKTLYNEQEQKLDLVKKKFHEIKDLYLKGIDEVDAIKLRNEREIKNTKDYAITKFAKEMLDVHDNFTRALSVVGEKDFKTLTDEGKDETFTMFVEGKFNNVNFNFLWKICLIFQFLFNNYLVNIIFIVLILIELK